MTSPLSLFAACGKDPLSAEAVSAQGLRKLYDKNLRGFVYALDKSLTTQLRLSTRSFLPLLVLQLRGSDTDGLNAEVTVRLADSQRRRIHLSTAFRSVESSALHVQVPWRRRGGLWTHVVVDLQRACHLYFASAMLSAETVILRPACRVRRVFALPYAAVTSEGLLLLPVAYEFPSASSSVNYEPYFVIDASPAHTPSFVSVSSQHPLVENNEDSCDGDDCMEEDMKEGVQDRICPWSEDVEERVAAGVAHEGECSEAKDDAAAPSPLLLASPPTTPRPSIDVIRPTIKASSSSSSVRRPPCLASAELRAKEKALMIRLAEVQERLRGARSAADGITS